MSDVLQSYNSYITDTLRGVKVYAGLKSQKTDNRIERRTFVWAAKFDMEGASCCCCCGCRRLCACVAAVRVQC